MHWTTHEQTCVWSRSRKVGFNRRSFMGLLGWTNDFDGFDDLGRPFVLRTPTALGTDTCMLPFIL